MSVLQNVILTQLSLRLDTLSLESFLPVRWLRRCIRALTELKGSVCYLDKDVIERRSMAVDTVFCTPVPVVVSAAYETEGDWVSCVEVLLMDNQFIMDSSIAVHSIMLTLIQNSRFPVHTSLIGALSAWIKRSVTSKSREKEIGLCLLPSEVVTLVEPLRNAVVIENLHNIVALSVPSALSAEYLPSILTCYCVLLQLEYLEIDRVEVIMDALCSEPRSLPLRGALYHLRAILRDDDSIACSNHLLCTELERLIEKFCPELFVSTDWMSCPSTIALENALILQQYKSSQQHAKKRKFQGDLFYTDLFTYATSELVNLALRVETMELRALDSLIAAFRIWKIIHSTVSCTQQFELATLNNIIDDTTMRASISIEGKTANSSRSVLRNIPSYSFLVREPILLFRLPVTILRNPFVLNVLEWIFQKLRFLLFGFIDALSFSHRSLGLLITCFIFFNCFLVWV